MKTGISFFRALFPGALLACALLADAHAQSAPTSRGGSDPIVFETRPPGQAGGGIVINETFPGQTFRLHERTEISALGVGNLDTFISGGTGETVFVALYQVDTPDTTPDVVGETGLLGATLLEVPATPSDVTGPLSLVVEPGIYAIVAGIGRHGATAEPLHAHLENAGTGAGPDTWSLPYTLNPQTGARSLQGATVRFFIEGQTLPPSEPSPTEFLMETARPTAWWTQTNSGITESFWLATRFEIARSTRVEQAGSWLHSGSGQVFAAIVELAGPGANPLPITHPGFMDTVAGTALINVGNTPRSYTGAFEDVELAAGHYALIIGTGMFGATGSASIMGVADEIVSPGTLVWTGSFWGEFQTSRRLFLTGFIPELAVTPDPADFGNVSIGETGAETITITNLRDDSDLQMSGIGVNANLHFGLGPDVDNCAVAVIEPGQSCQFTMLFNPSETGPEAGILQVWSDGEPSPFVIDLIGHGTVPELAFDPAALDFGDVDAGSSSGALFATLSNTGGADAEGLSFELDGDFGVQLNDCGNTLPAGEDCQLGIEFIPGATGPAGGTLDVSADGGYTVTLALSGNGVDAPAPALDYGPASFAFELFPDETDQRELVIGNLGAGDLTWSLDSDMLGMSGARDHDPMLDEPIAIPDFEIDASSNGGQPATFTLPAGVISRGEVVGFSFTGTVAGITGTPSWAFEMCMIVTAPDGSSYAVGGRFAVPGCGLHSWDFDGPDDGTYESMHDNVFDSAPDAGAWTFAFHNAWHDPDAATMTWSDVTVTLHKIPAPCLDPAEVDWLDVDPVSGTIAPASDDTVIVTADAGGLGEGQHTASLCLSSNDADTPLAVIPVALRVETPAPAMSLNPESFEFEIMQGDADGDVLTIANTGDADLAWDLLEAPTVRGDALILLDENFDGGFPPSGWNTPDEGGLPCPWRTSDDYGMDDWNGTARGAAVDSDNCLDDAVPPDSIDSSLVSPALDLAHVTNARVDFDLAYRHLGSSRLTLEISTDDGTSWTELETWSSHFAYPDDPSLPVSVDLSAYDGKSRVTLRWRYRSGWDWWALVDNVVVSADPPENCYDPAVDTWLEAQPSSGTLEPEDTQLVDIQVDAAELPTGPYVTTLCVQSNVPGNPLVAIPVALSVIAPALTLDPELLDFGQVAVGENGGPLTVTLTNTGSADLVIDEIAGPGEPFTPAGGTCDNAPFTLPPGDNCKLDFTFDPVNIGKVDALLTVTGNAPSSPDEIILSGIGTAAVLELVPASFMFELVTGQSDTGVLTIGNAGNIDLDWTIAAESNCGAGNAVEWLSATPPAGATVPGGATPIDVVVDARGLAAGLHDAVLCISGNALGAPQTEIPVSLTVTAPDLLFDPSELDFGDVEIDAGDLTLYATLHNQGDSDATELDFLVPAGFSADIAACGAALPAGGECEIAVIFDPSEIGMVEGTLIVGSAKGVTTELALTGNGIEPGALGVDPDHLDFGDVVITTTRTLGFAVTNTAGAGADPIELASISLESGGPAFAIDHIDCMSGTVLAPGESCAVQISFTPVEVAGHEGMVRIAASDGQKVTVPLSGTVLGDTVFADRFEQP